MASPAHCYPCDFYAKAGVEAIATREEAPQVPIIVRAASQEGVQQLFALGAEYVIFPEPEGGLETLTLLGYRASDAQGYTDAVRSSRYDLSASTDAEQYALEQMLGETKRANRSPVAHVEGRIDPEQDSRLS